MKESMKKAIALGGSIGMVLGIFTTMILLVNAVPEREAINIIVFDMMDHYNDGFIAVYTNGTGKLYLYGDYDKEALLSYKQGDHLVLEVKRRSNRRYAYDLYDFYPMSECLDENGYLVKYPRASSPIWGETK